MFANSASASEWSGVPSDRVVAVLAHLNDNQVQIGSGFLITGRRVLTAFHCIIDGKTHRSARSLQVVRRSDGAACSAMLDAAALGVAVLQIDENCGWPPLLEPVKFGRVDRSRARQLVDCQAIGFPAWQIDPQDQGRNAAELHGTIRATEDVESGLLVMRDTELADVAIPNSAANEDRGNSTWGGLSGALVFYEGLALGVIVEHHPRQGNSALRILPVERLAARGSGARQSLASAEQFTAADPEADLNIASVANALGLPAAADLPLVGRVEFPAIPRPQAYSPISLTKAGSDSERITLDVIMRGPLQTPNLMGRLAEATAEEQTAPASAAVIFAEIAKQLTEKGFAPHARAIYRRAIQAYSTAGHTQDAVRLQLRLMVEMIREGRWTDVSIQSLVLQEIAKGANSSGLSVATSSVVDALQSLVGLLEDPVLTADTLSAAFYATVRHLETGLGQLPAEPTDSDLLVTAVATIAVTAAELAVAAEASDIVVSALGTLDQIANSLANSSDATLKSIYVRLCLATAEAQNLHAGSDERWERLSQAAAAWKLRDEDAALVFGRYGRAKAVAAKSSDADIAWRRAVECGGRARLFSDTAGWLSSQWRLRHRYGPMDAEEIQNLRQMIQLLTEQPSSRLIPDGDARPETLEAMRRGDQGLRSAALAAQRLRVLSAAAGHWEEELQAHSLLSDIFELSGEPSLAAFHSIRAGERPSEKITSHPEAFIDVTRELRRPAPAERSAAYAILAAQGDLIPDSLTEYVGSCAAADIKAVMDSKIIESPVAGPGVMRSALDAAATIAARLSNDVAEQVMLALDERLTGQEGSFARTDQSHLKLLADLAGSADDTVAAAALTRLARLLAIRSPALRGGGRSLGSAVRRRPVAVRGVLTQMAAEGHDEAAELLAGWSLTGSPGTTADRDEAEQAAWLTAFPFAQSAADRLASAPPGTPGSASLFVHFARDAALVTLLDPPDVDRALGGLLRVAVDHLHLSATRQQALDAASILVAGQTGNGLGSHRLSEVFDLACEFARGEHDGSAMDELMNSSHPLSSWRINTGDSTLVAYGLHLAARAARDNSKRTIVLELAANVVLSEPSETILHDTGRALTALGTLDRNFGLDSGPDSLSVTSLARSSSPSLRAVAAVYWAKLHAAAGAASNLESTGANLARDMSSLVRRSMIAQLVIVASESGLSPAGIAAVNVLANDPLADIRESAATILEMSTSSITMFNVGF